MAEIVLFHSVLGLRPGVTDAAERLRSAGHVVHTPDFYEGKVFDGYSAAFQWVESIGGIPEFISRTQTAVADLPEDVVFAGFSTGAYPQSCWPRPGQGPGPPCYCTPRCRWRRSALRHGPQACRSKVHYAADDPFRKQESIDAFAAAVRGSGAAYEFFEYPVSGHLITDASLPGEYHQESAQTLFERVLAFLERIDRT